MKILVAVDESACSDAAIESIIDRDYNLESTEIKVVTVIEPVVYEYTVTGIYFESLGEAQKELRKNREALLQTKIEELLKAFPKAKISAGLLDGPAADCIIDEAKSWQADLVVVGSHSRSGLEHFLLGSVAEKVVNHSPCSVEVVKKKKILNGTDTNQQKGQEQQALAL